MTALLREIVAAERPDVIHVHNLMNPVALRALRRLGPVVKSIHDCRPFCVKPFPYVASRLVGDSNEFCTITLGGKCWGRCYFRAGKGLAQRAEAWSDYPANLLALREVLACDRLVVYSDYLRDLALAASQGRARVEVIHHYSDLENDIPFEQLDREKIPMLLFVGRLSREKGVFHMIEALRRMPQTAYRIVITGDGPEKDAVTREIATLSPKHLVTLNGYVGHDELQRLYREASLVVFPSIGSEGCPLTGIEAMYMGTPVVAFGVGGVPEWLIDGQTGILVQRANIDDLAIALMSLIQNDGRRRELGRNAHAFVRGKFRKNMHLERLLSVYQAVADEKRLSGGFK